MRRFLTLLILAFLASQAGAALRERSSIRSSENPRAKPATEKTTKTPPRKAAPVKADPVSPDPFPNYPVPPRDREPELRPRPTQTPFAGVQGRWRIHGGGFGGWWWGDLRDKEREYADGILVDLGGGDYERLRLLHTVVGPFASVSRSIRPWLYTGLRAQMIFVTQAADLPGDFERVSAGVWRTGSLQTTLTFCPLLDKRNRPYLELAYGPAWGSWSSHAAANRMPPRQRQVTDGAVGELWGLGLGWEHYRSPRSGWALDLRWNVGDFSVERLTPSQYNGHFTISLAAVWRP